jgi:GT2 family glycosyltransferase
VRGCWVLSSTRADGRLRKVAAAVVNWNDLQRSLRCLASINEVSPGSQLILVDNGPAADPTSDVKAQAPYVRVLRLDTNRGYAGGCNAGAEAAMACGAEFLLFLNNDTTLNRGAASSVAVGQ